MQIWAMVFPVLCLWALQLSAADEVSCPSELLRKSARNRFTSRNITGHVIARHIAGNRVVTHPQECTIDYFNSFLGQLARPSIAIYFSNFEDPLWDGGRFQFQNRWRSGIAAHEFYFPQELTPELPPFRLFGDPIQWTRGEEGVPSSNFREFSYRNGVVELMSHQTIYTATRIEVEIRTARIAVPEDFSSVSYVEFTDLEYETTEELMAPIPGSLRVKATARVQGPFAKVEK